MCQFSSIEIERCRLKSIQWARRIAGRGASFNCLHDFGGDGWSMGRFGANPYTAIRKANRTAGRCSCGGELDARRDGRAYAFCPVCRDRQRRQSVKRHASAVSTGSCSWPGCDASAAAGRRRCEAHLVADRASGSDRRAAARLAAVDRPPGACVECGAASVDGGFRCARHVELHAGRCARRRAARALARGAAA